MRIIMKYPITATFIDEITYDITPQNWGEKEWINDLRNMKNLGIDTAVIMRSVFYDKCIYPSKRYADKKRDYDDFIGLVLDEADKLGLKIYIGLYISNLTWNDGDYETEIKENEFLVDEILELYDHHESFIGWYLPHEVGHENYNFVPVTVGLIEILKRKSADKLILLSPFFRGQNLFPDPQLTPEQTYEEWDRMFAHFGKDIDVCAFQDGTTLLEDLEDYILAAKRVCDKYDIELWSNVETFERDEHATFPPINFDILTQKIAIAQKHCAKIITFEFSHFLSPQSMYDKARENCKKYIDKYGK